MYNRFCYLGICSLYRLWNIAALDNQLWKSLYTTRFCNNRIVTLNHGLKIHGVTRSDETVRLPVSISMGDGIDCRSAYITAYKGILLLISDTKALCISAPKEFLDLYSEKEFSSKLVS